MPDTLRVSAVKEKTMATERQKMAAAAAFRKANHDMEEALHVAANVNTVGDLILRIPVEEDSLRTRLQNMRDRRAIRAGVRLLKAEAAYTAAQKRCVRLGIWP